LRAAIEAESSSLAFSSIDDAADKTEAEVGVCCTWEVEEVDEVDEEVNDEDELDVRAARE